MLPHLFHLRSEKKWLEKSEKAQIFQLLIDKIDQFFQLLIDKSKKKALIITRDSEQVIEANDMQIEVTPIWKWLLKD